MQTQMDLFNANFIPKYPNAPAQGRTETSRMAAEKIAPRVKESHRQILAELAKHNLTADELATALGKRVLYVRPRVSELKKLELIIESGVKRLSSEGNMQAEYRLINGKDSIQS